MSAITVQAQGDSNFYALLSDNNLLGEVQVNGEFLESSHHDLVQFAVNLIECRYPNAPANAVWQQSTEVNRVTLVEESNNLRQWLLVLTQTEGLIDV